MLLLAELEPGCVVIELDPFALLELLEELLLELLAPLDDVLPLDVVLLDDVTG